MPDRLPWKRGDRPEHFIAMMPEGTAEIWWQSTGPSGTAGWRYRLASGPTISSGFGSDKQHAADQATTFWPNVVRQEQARLAKIEDARQLEQQLDAAYGAGRVDVMSFGLGTATYDRLIKINEFLRHKNMLVGPLKPLAEAVSAELFRRRTGG